VVSVPAYFNDAQRSATKYAAALAGLPVERLVNEPSAAALACRVRDEEADGCFLVFDFGGGTLDVSVVECFENIVEIIAIAGSNRLGGDDFDQVIANRFCLENGLDLGGLRPEERAVVLSAARQCKFSLSGYPQAVMRIEQPKWSGTLQLTNEGLAELSAKLLTDVRRVVERALRDCRQEIDRVVLVGGSCKMPLVRQYVRHLLNKPFADIADPDTTVALGAGIYAGVKARNGDIRDVLLTDICPFTLGTGVHNHQAPSRPFLSPIIERNTTLPSSRVKQYFTVYDGQTTINCEVYQGEELYAQDNLLLGALEVDVPPAPAGQESVDVRYTYDINGLLEVEVTVVSTQKRVEKELMSKGSHLSGRELEQKRKELAALKSDPPDEAENRYLLERSQRLFTELFGPEREILMARTQAFQQILSANKHIALRKEREAFAAFLDTLEENLFTFSNDGNSL
jgi:molecular chaperone HscC